MLKKFVSILAAAMLTLAAGNAFAAFSSGDLIRVVYNHAGTVEVATDLGSMTSLLSGGSVNSDTFSLSTITGATSASDLYVAYFAYTGAPTGTGYVGAATAPVTGSRKYTGFTNAIASFNSYYNSINTTNATTVVGDQSQANSYAKALTNSGALYGGLNGYIPAANGEENLAALLARGGQTTIYSFAGQSGASGVTTGVATPLTLITTFDAGTGIGSTTTPSATPIPAAVYLLGSGLMGLFGLRRKGNKA